MSLDRATSEEVPSFAARILVKLHAKGSTGFVGPLKARENAPKLWNGARLQLPQRDNVKRYVNVQLKSYPAADIHKITEHGSPFNRLRNAKSDRNIVYISIDCDIHVYEEWIAHIQDYYTPRKGNFDPSYEFSEYDTISPKEELEYTKESFSRHIKFLINNLITVFQISCPSDLKIDDACIIFEDNEIEDLYLFIESPLFSLRELENEHNLALLIRLEFFDVWRWLSHREGVFFGYPIEKNENNSKGDMPIDRAVCNFIALFESDHHAWIPNRFFASIAALETLLTEGREGIQKQLTDKLSCIFGASVKQGLIETYMKNLYHIRSRAIHGSISNRSHFLNDIDFSKESKIEKEVRLAAYFLTALLQRMIYRGKDRIPFRLILEL